MALLTWADAAKLARDCQSRGGVVVTTNGCFDILHKGHVQYLQEARSQGDLLLVGLNTDASVKKLKGPTRPVNDEQSRSIVLSALRAVNGVCVFDEATPSNWLSAIRPNIHVKGGDYKAEELPETAVLKTWGGKVVILPFVEGVSTTEIIKKISSK